MIVVCIRCFAGVDDDGDDGDDDVDDDVDDDDDDDDDDDGDDDGRRLTCVARSTLGTNRRTQVSSELSWRAWRACLGRSHASLANQRKMLTAFYAKHDSGKQSKQIDEILDKRRCAAAHHCVEPCVCVRGMSVI
jgi:hypothetical protein